MIITNNNTIISSIQVCKIFKVNKSNLTVAIKSSKDMCIGRSLDSTQHLVQDQVFDAVGLPTQDE